MPSFLLPALTLDAEFIWAVVSVWRAWNGLEGTSMVSIMESGDLVFNYLIFKVHCILKKVQLFLTEKMKSCINCQEFKFTLSLIYTFTNNSRLLNTPSYSELHSIHITCEQTKVNDLLFPLSSYPVRFILSMWQTFSPDSQNSLQTHIEFHLLLKQSQMDYSLSLQLSRTLKYVFLI